ncbi:MAG: Na+/H+ antiporter subunit E, partial [Pseudomonadota bacterium]|nr:Na+/H+ antiporter subunit E [Pseudomonadota bacterium]
VCLIIINPSHKVKPEVIEIEALDVSKITNVLYANSITLTPGTLTLDVDKNKMKIHTLDAVFKQSLLTQEMAKKVDVIDGRLNDRS